MKIEHTIMLCFLLLVVTACSSINSDAEVSPTESTLKFSGVAYPESYRTEFVQYATVERVDGTVRDLYVNSETADYMVMGRMLPNNSVIVVEGYYAQLDENGDALRGQDGRYVRGEPFEMLHVMEKRSGWSDDDFVSMARVGDWNFGSFEVESGQPFEEDMNSCFNCHNPVYRTDFVHSYTQLVHYTERDQVQYFYCDLVNRLPC